jgi:asparagine synthase (glutamine-hydrolysing)
MCGICGQFNFGSDVPVARKTLERMTSSLVHRGPDDEGYFLDGTLGLGFRRLSIIDLAGGHQPMSDRDETTWVVFNGEIYNYLELRRELEAHGHVFRTASDTEVIVHGYKQWGEEVLNHLNGMFGLAIWDVRKKRLTIARDPFGIKGIYYRVLNGTLFFGSEIRAIQAGDSDLGEIDPLSLNLFLRYRYTPAPHTIYRDVRKLPAGTMITCDRDGVVVQRWYRQAPQPFAPPKSDRDAEAELTELYRQAMKRHLLSDVPVGLLLSGGVDSGLLLALMNGYGQDWQTYSVGYGSGFADDELVDAAETASLFRSRHTAVELEQGTFEEALPKIVSFLEEPIASSSIVPMYFVCMRARQDVKVALMGQGPDELFGGYRRHLGVRYASLWSTLPRWAQEAATSMIGALPRNETLKRGARSLGNGDRMTLYQNVLSLTSGPKVDALFIDGILPQNGGDAILDCWRDFAGLSEQLDVLGGFQFLEMRSTLPDELLMYADKLSMAHSLEVRVPYLDREIVEFVERLPSRLKVRAGERKWLHRQVCRRMLPDRILRRKKRGFGVNVVDDWFRQAVGSALQEALEDSQSLMYQYLSFPSVQRLLAAHKSGREDNHKLLFSLVIFEQWLRVQTGASRVPQPA